MSWLHGIKCNCCTGGGACCADAVCTGSVTETNCEAGGDTYVGDGTSCTGTICDVVTIGSGCPSCSSQKATITYSKATKPGDDCILIAVDGTYTNQEIKSFASGSDTVKCRVCWACATDGTYSLNINVILGSPPADPPCHDGGCGGGCGSSCCAAFYTGVAYQNHCNSTLSLTSECFCSCEGLSDTAGASAFLA